MRLAIVPGPIDRVHHYNCHHAQEAIRTGRSARVQGPTADALLEDLRGVEANGVLLSDGSRPYRKGYLAACKVCRPEQEAT